MTKIKNQVGKTISTIFQFFRRNPRESHCSILGRVQSLCREGEEVIVSIAPWSQFSAEVHRFMTTNPFFQAQLLSAEIGGQLVAIEARSLPYPLRRVKRSEGELLKVCMLSRF